MQFDVPPHLTSDATETRSCRASLVVLSGWEIGREFVVGEGETVLGRSPAAHATIDHPSISRQHCRVEQSNADGSDLFVVSDLGSTNGTFVNNTRVSQREIHNGDRIQVGDVVLKFMIQDAKDAELFQEIHRQIHYDRLTGLLTLDAFRRQLESDIRSAGREGRFALAMTDMDGLKKVNDTHGHSAGTYVIQTMGNLMREVVGPENRAGLYGGDEAIVQYRGMDLDSARAVAEQLRARIESHPWVFGGNKLQVTISQGLAEWPKHGLSADALINAADQALYKAKSDGRNCVRVQGE